MLVLFPAKSFIVAFIALVIIISGSILAYMTIEGWSFLESLWVAVVSITTVGYGDMVPATHKGRIITLLLIISGVGLYTYVLSNILLALVEGQFFNVWGKKKMMNKIEKLHNHIIVCGAGRVGSEVINQLKHEKFDFVVIEKNPEREEYLHNEGALYIIGDATEDKVLVSAGIYRARSVITTLPDDAGNLFITITSKDLNPKVRVVARVNRPEGIQRMRRSGADSVVAPSLIAGNRMALSAIKPASVNFVQTLIEKHDLSFELEELQIGKVSLLAGQKLKDSGLRENFNTQVLAIQRNGEVIVNPSPSEVLLPGDVLILFGPEDQLGRLEKILSGE